MDLAANQCQGDTHRVNQGLVLTIPDLPHKISNISSYKPNTGIR